MLDAVIALVQGLAAAVPPDLAAGAVLLMAGSWTLVAGLVRRGRAFLRHAPGAVLVIAGAALVFPLSLPGVATELRIATLAIAAVALLGDLMLHPRAPVDPPQIEARLGRRYLAAALAAAAFLLLHDLGGYAGSLLVWEVPVIGGFADAFTARQGVLNYVAQLFVWDEGLMSAGHTSLFYGAPAYALFHLVGFSPWTLRCMAVLATLLSIVLMYAIGRRFFGPIVGAAAALLLALSQCALFYGRYGSSPAGTLLAVLLALLCTWHFLDRDRSAWWTGVVCAAALYVTTLQYSPARIVVLILLGFVIAVAAWQWRRLWWQRAVGVMTIIAAAVAVWRLQGSFDSQQHFLFARGEQFFNFLNHQDYIREYLGRPVMPEALTPFDAIELLVRILQMTIPQYIALLRPHVNPVPPGAFMALDPPPLPLYFAPFAVFVVWGLGRCVAQRSWRHACLLVWVTAGTVPLLLTNRVDAHRMMLFVIPITLWTALGVREGARVMAHAQIGPRVQHLVAAALALSVFLSDVNLLYYSARVETPRVPYALAGIAYPRIPSCILAKALAEVIAAIPGRVEVGSQLDQREMGWLQLTLLERTWQNPQRRAAMIDSGLLDEVSDRPGAPLAARLRELQQIATQATLILAPSNRFQSAAAALQGRGLRVAAESVSGVRLLRIDAGAAATGVPNEALQALPTLVMVPTPTPIPLATGPRVELHTLAPSEMNYSFAPANIDRAWDGSPIVMGGVHYQHGLGTHAWCRVRYSVPPNAVSFQAIIGLSDDTRECPVATGVTFEVRDDQDRLLFDSGFVDAATAPRPVQVDVHDTAAITLVVTDGGNGRDCDHANWASAAFLTKAE